MTLLSRRHVLGLGVGRAERGLAPAGDAHRSRATESHGMSAFGDLKYPADFHHFDYVNPDAPKGGLFSTIPSDRPTTSRSRPSIRSMPLF